MSNLVSNFGNKFPPLLGAYTGENISFEDQEGLNEAGG
jgi:hypothetical protein